MTKTLNKIFMILSLNFSILNGFIHFKMQNGTKIMKFGLKCFILHFKMDKTIKTIKCERIFFLLETFLESLQEIHVKAIVYLTATFHFKGKKSLLNLGFMVLVLFFFGLQFRLGPLTL